ncbi:hypothetical protein THASP1DRAFT_33080 [Thamnocephalis sphaerospora]|uniref:non-specific serine/threonine protein kinase n=1 Tax=Thamnocephalis sphaerospora TaxID=78915 RepID=A0A4V1IVS6_9FUNG|nr:hypothetical protein THASP1DRAFT_33080 [Thamnocephalis sphaerospora]|eukprot:RKP05089.1 hypothetical protein THASP1DRAFT_33080 [Thamnocephalis sphaerospora]
MTISNPAEESAVSAAHASNAPQQMQGIQHQTAQSQEEKDAELEKRCRGYLKELSLLDSMEKRLEKDTEKMMTEGERAAFYRGQVKEQQKDIDRQKAEIDVEWLNLARELVITYCGRHLPGMPEHKRLEEVEIALKWSPTQQENAITKHSLGNWHGPGSPFYDIYKRYLAARRRENASNDDVEALMSRDYVDNYSIVSTKNDLAEYAKPLLRKLLNKRTCLEVNEPKAYGQHFDGYYKVSDAEEPFNDMENNQQHSVQDTVSPSPDDKDVDDPPPFCANRLELRTVDFFRCLLGKYKHKMCTTTEYDFRVWIQALLVETKLRLTEDVYEGLFVTRDYPMPPDACYFSDSVSAGKRSRSVIRQTKPDFRVSIVPHAWLNGWVRGNPPYIEELCFMQCEVKKENATSKEEAKFFNQMAESLRGQEYLYNINAQSVIKSEHGPFCVGALLTGFDIEFYFAFMKRSGEGKYKCHIYLYKKVSLAGGDGEINGKRFVEASAAFCNQIDLVRERLRTDHADFSSSSVIMAEATGIDGKRLMVKVFVKESAGEHERKMHLYLSAFGRCRGWEDDMIPKHITKLVWDRNYSGCPVIVTEEVQKTSRQTWTPVQLTELAHQVAKTLHILHDKAQVVHGDIKPANLIVTERKDDSQMLDVILCDFGSMQYIDGPFLRDSTGGTDGYLAPENDGWHPTAASDIYSFGILR